MDSQTSSGKPAVRGAGVFSSPMVSFWTYMAGGIGIVAGLLGLLMVYVLA